MAQQFQAAPRVEPMSKEMASRTVRKYVCSGCWSPLEEKPADNGRSIVLCTKCGEATQGYVSYKFTLRQTEDSFIRAHQARINLREAIGYIPYRAQTEIKNALKDGVK